MTPMLQVSPLSPERVCASWNSGTVTVDLCGHSRTLSPFRSSGEGEDGEDTASKFSPRFPKRSAAGAQRSRFPPGHAQSFLALQAAGTQIVEVDGAHALSHRKIGIPGLYAGVAIVQAIVRGAIQRWTHRGPTFSGMQRFDAGDRRQAGPGLQE